MPEAWLFVVGVFVTILAVLACLLIGRGEAKDLESDVQENGSPWVESAGRAP